MLFKLLVRLSCYIGFSSAFLSCTTKSSNSLLLRKALSFVAANKLPCSFHDFNIPEWLVKRCEELGYLHPTLPQQLSLPSILEGKDVVLQAQTGSGKTLTFVLPVLTSITPSRSAIQAVVVVPTRELGQQVVSTFKLLAHGSPEKIMIMSVLEGSMNRRQQLWATAEPPHIVVGNPKALQKLVDIGRLRLNSVNMVVIDEVDACLINADTRQVTRIPLFVSSPNNDTTLLKTPFLIIIN
jgi:superfamily II DNA/RNA helicase